MTRPASRTEAVAPGRRSRAIQAREVLSGRQDLNLRPPGPQPDMGRPTGPKRPQFAGFFVRSIRYDQVKMVHEQYMALSNALR